MKHIYTFIESSKTDIYRDGQWVTLSCNGTVLCAVVNLRKYLKLANFSTDSNMYILCGLSKYKSGYKLYYLKRAIFRSFKDHASDISIMGLHELRDGATAAANNGIKDKLFKRHSTWRSENTKHGYIKDCCLAQRLSVSQNLGS